jgi:fluoride exporter
MKGLLLVAAGGALGSGARYLMSGWVLQLAPAARFPWGTFAVNVIGCLVAGLAAGYLLRTGTLGADARLFLFTGLLGGFTTFSAFGVETVALLRKGEVLIAGANAVGSVVVAVGALWLAMAVLQR